MSEITADEDMHHEDDCPYREDAEKLRDYEKQGIVLTIKPTWDNFLRLKAMEERLKKLPIDLILQHIRDSFSEDRELMSVNAQMETTKCIEDLMELQKILGEEK